MSSVNGAQRWLIVPIETKVRELEAKTLFACAAAERGWGTVLGRTNAVDRDRLPRGLFVLKGIPPGCGRSLRILRRMGQKITSWCEEGLIYRSADEYGLRKFETSSFSLLELFFAWGSHHARDLVDHLACDSSRLVVTGNPRFDLLRPEFRTVFFERAARLQQAHGRFILFNTKLNRYNNYFGNDWYINRMRMLGRRSGAAVEAEAMRCVEFQRVTFLAFVDAVAALSRRFPETAIVVRPHPSENHEPWKHVAANWPNVRVIFEGNVIPWLMAAGVIIQNNCTTGVESFLLGRPSIAYRPILDPSSDMVLPNAVSVGAFSLESLFDLTDAALRGEPLPADDLAGGREMVREYASGIDGPTACEAILDAIDGCDVPLQRVPAERPIALKGTTGDRVTGPELFYGEAGPTRYRSYRQQKCDGVTLEEVHPLLDRLRRATGRFADVRVDAVGKDLLCIRGH